MTHDLIEQKFAAIGARAQISVPARATHRARPKPATPARAFTINILNDKRGEFFDLRVGDQQVEIIDVQPKDRHLLLLVRDGKTKSRFLCGHDERHWFTAAIPEAAPGVTGVKTAKLALQPPGVQERIRRVHPKDPLRRRNQAYVRQGEWFAIPEPDFAPPDPTAVLRNEPLTRGRGKAHTMEYAYRTGGTTVYRGLGGRVFTQNQYDALSQVERRKLGITNAMVRDATVYARGKLSHPDHKTIVLPCWHRIAMNTEQSATAMRSVMFLD